MQPLNPPSPQAVVDNETGIDIYAYNEDWTIEKFLNPHDPTGFIGREAELKRLDDFANDNRNFVFWAIAGSSGSGKTKLYTAWMNKLGSAVSGWKHETLDRDTSSKYFDSEWQPEKPTLFIIDYIFGYGDEFRKILNHSKRQLKHKVRLLIVDHIFPKKLEDLHKDWRFGYVHTEYWKSKSEGSATKLATIFFDTNQTALRLEETNASDQEHIIKTIIRRLAPNATEAKIEEARDYLWYLSDGTDTQEGKAWKPLFAGLVGDALRNNRNYHSPNRRVLIEEYLDSAKRLPWRRKELEAKIASVYIAVATALRGVNYDVLKEGINKEAIPQNFDGFPAVTAICTRVVSHQDEDNLVQFEPDFLGETYFLLLLKALDNDELSDELKESFYSMLSLGSEQNGDLGVLKFVGFMKNLTRNLGGNDQDNQISGYWERLLKFLDPQRFSEESPMRWAVSAVLLDMYMSRKNVSPKDAIEYLNLVDFNLIYQVPKNENLWAYFLHYSLIYSSSILSQMDLISSSNKIHELNNKQDQFLTSYCRSLSPDQRQELFLQCCYDGWSLTVISSLIELGVNVNCRDNNQNTALFIAASRGNTNIVRILISFPDLKINEKNHNNSTALMAAISIGSADILDLLLKDGRIKVNIKNGNHLTELIIACYTERLDIVIRLLAHPSLNVNEPDKECKTALMHSVCLNSIEIVYALITRPELSEPSKSMPTWIMYVTSSGKNHLSFILVCIIITLLRLDLDVNAVDKRNRSALAYACIQGHQDIVKALLIRPDLDVNVQDNNCNSPLSIVSSFGYVDVLKLLLTRNDLDINARHDSQYTALFFACGKGNIEVVKILLDAKADRHLKSIHGETALDYAREAGYTEIVDLLLNYPESEA